MVETLYREKHGRGMRINAFPALKDGDFFSKRAAFRPGE